MKKLLVLPVLLGAALIFAWCENQQLTNEQYCNNNWWTLEIRSEWGEESSVCSFNDHSFCYIEDLVNHACNPGELFYEDESTSEENTVEENNNQEPEENDVEETITPNQQEGYVTDTHEEMSFEEIGDALMSCDDLWEDLVCGVDGGTYYNRCYLEFAGIQEQPEAKIVDWICLYE